MIPKNTVVQSVGRAAGKTFMQSFLSYLVTTCIPLLMIVQADLFDGPPFDKSSIALLGWALLGCAVGALAAVISWVQNTYFPKQ